LELNHNNNNEHDSEDKGGVSVKEKTKKPGLLEMLFGRRRSPETMAPAKPGKKDEAEEIDEADWKVNAELLRSVEASVRDIDSRLERLEKKKHKSIIDSLKKTDKRLNAVTNMEHRVKKTEVRIARCEIILKKIQQQKRGD